MDISSLLSSQEPHRNDARNAAIQSARAQQSRARSAKDSSLLQQATTSPLLHGITRSPDSPLRPSPILSPVSGINGSRTNYSPTPHQSPMSPPTYHPAVSSHEFTSPRAAHRNSLASMETLADLATMQQYQPVQRNTQPLRKELQEPRRSSLTQSMRPSSSSHGSGSVTPASLRVTTAMADHPMSDAPVATIPATTYEAASLSDQDLRTIYDLSVQLNENSYLYDSHAQLVRLLHGGFVAHVNPAAGSSNDPDTYELLTELRQARAAMNSRFTMGEELWSDWILDEITIASSTEDRIGVMEFCQKATNEEVGSVTLWKLYGDWMWFLYVRSFKTPHERKGMFLDSDDFVTRLITQQIWSEEDRLAGQEIFSWETMFRVWQQAVQATEWHINDSHLTWDSMMDVLIQDLNRSHGNPDSIKGAEKIFATRLSQPHSTWDATFQLFSELTSKYNDSNYEQNMAAAIEKAKKAKQQYELRREREEALQRAIIVGDRILETQIFEQYLEWEFAQQKKKHSPFGLGLLIGLCERAHLRFPTEASFWEDHLDLLNQSGHSPHQVTETAHQATRHCPWSGALWSQRLYALESANYAFDTLEDVKHHATSTGLLEEFGGMDELIKFYAAWCGFLRRRAFAPNAAEDDRDVAEVGIRSALENVKTTGEKKYGKDFKGDPLFRIERIYTKFFGQTGQWEGARDIWQKLTITHGDQYEFWDKYYLWEMTIWGMDRGLASADKAAMPTPEKATEILQRAIKRPNLDWPEKMIQTYLHHCGQHETVKKLQEAHIEARAISKRVAKRRAKEAAEAVAAQRLMQDQYQAVEVMSHDQEPESSDNKRKRSHDQESSEKSNKKARANDETHQEESTQVKRDRENTMVIAKGFPAEATDAGIRHFFRGCGNILSLKVTAEKNNSMNTAMVEFESHHDVLTAQTRDLKTFEGNTIEIQIGLKTTLFVTNYPAEADEAWIRRLFSDYGEVVEVRLPSLRANAHRRFCYVQFLTEDEAKAATELDGKALSKGIKLQVKISDPSAKKDRVGATQEGREIYVGNCNWSASEADVQAAFSKYGSIEHVRIPRDPRGNHKGAAFVVFATKEEAESALDMNAKQFHDRILNVAMSKPKNFKPHSTTVIRDSATPDAENQQMKDGNDEDKASYHERTLAIMNIPDTINDARIRALAETYGALIKVTLRPDHQGATVEFAQVADAGKASMALEGYEISPGRLLHIGSTAELRKWKPEIKEQQVKPSKPQLMAPLKRPGQPAAKRSGRGGLGFKKSAESRELNGPTAEKDKGGKTQDDFRAMLNKS